MRIVKAGKGQLRFCDNCLPFLTESNYAIYDRKNFPQLVLCENCMNRLVDQVLELW